MPTIELIARALLRRGPYLLLCRNLKSGYTFLPGGHIEFGEPAAKALARELKEEAGLKVKVGPLLLTSECAFRAKGKRHHELNLVFHVEHSWGRTKGLPEVRSRESHIGFEWVRVSEVAGARLLPHSMVEWLGSGNCSTWNSEFRGM